MLKRKALIRLQPNICRQGGMTLMELLIAGAISIIASAGMLVLMANTLGSGTKTIKMTRLSQEMRSALQIMTRELRRANYHGTYATCFGDADCVGTLGISSVVKDIAINGGSGGSCFWFWYDRPQNGGTEVAVTSEQVAAFRRTTDGSGVGSIEMSVSGTGAPNCNVDSDSWQPITDPNVCDVTAFAITNTESFATTVTGAGATMAINRIGISMTGSLVDDASIPEWMGGSAIPTVQIQDFIRVRNDVSSPPGP
jgi:prepilin peptidase dependent protein B